MNLSLITSDHSAFVLLKGSQEIASLKYNQQSHSIRIRSTERRLFFLSAAGLLQNKILLTTEYGVEIGENYHIKNRNKGILYLTEEKFVYTVSNDAIDIRDRSKKMIASCKLDGADKLDSYEISAVVFSLTWLFNPSYKENQREALPVL